MGRASERTDEELLSASADDPQALALFYRRHVHAVLGFFAARTADPEAAADLMAETFAAVVLAAPSYSPAEGTAVAWLFGIARHKLIDSYRRGRVQSEARRRLGLAALVLDDDDMARVIELTDESRSGHPALAALRDLPGEQQAAVRARVLDDREYAEIAVELRLSEAVVRKRVSRGLQAIRSRLGTQ